VAKAICFSGSAGEEVILFHSDFVSVLGTVSPWLQTIVVAHRAAFIQAEENVVRRL